MFLVGTALLMFGVGLYVMFVGSWTTGKQKESSGLLYIMKVRTYLITNVHFAISISQTLQYNINKYQLANIYY